MKFPYGVLASLLLVACDGGGPGGGDDFGRGTVPVPRGTGETIFTTGQDPANPFFKELGTNQRTCTTCHDPAAGWSITPTALQDRFDATGGADPVFRPLDGATSPVAEVSTLEARRAAYSALLAKGLIRVGRPIPPGAELALVAVDDPYQFASANELSLFRRPLPATNLRFLTEIMWDTREPTLAMQADDATMGHAQATGVERAAIDAAVAFESSLYSAQREDEAAGDLTAGASGGAQALVTQPFHVGMNDPTTTFDRDVFTMFAAWTQDGDQRAAIARGERLFNTREFRIRDVGGLADQDGTCSTCHNAPNVGSRTVAGPLNIGTADERFRSDDLPLYTLRNTATGATTKTSDPGLALTTGKWSDIGKFKVPSLRGLAMRPPYFHNGLARDVEQVLRFYERKFDMDFSDRERADLGAFLEAL